MNELRFKILRAYAFDSYDNSTGFAEQNVTVNAIIQSVIGGGTPIGQAITNIPPSEFNLTNETGNST